MCVWGEGVLFVGQAVLDQNNILTVMIHNLKIQNNKLTKISMLFLNFTDNLL